MWHVRWASVTCFLATDTTGKHLWHQFTEKSLSRVFRQLETKAASCVRNPEAVGAIFDDIQWENAQKHPKIAMLIYLCTYISILCLTFGLDDETDIYNNNVTQPPFFPNVLPIFSSTLYLFIYQCASTSWMLIYFKHFRLVNKTKTPKI